MWLPLLQFNINPPSKIICPGEFNLDHEVETLAASRNVERLKSYKFIACISHQVWHLSSGTLSIEDFKATPEMLQEPLRSGSQRRVHNGTIMVKHHDEEDWHRQDLTLAPTIPVIFTHDGSRAHQHCCNRLALWSRVMVHCQFDKFHRLARDLTNSKGSRLTQSQMKSSYIFGVNYKPYGQGSFFDEKRTILSQFMASCHPEPHSYFSNSNMLMCFTSCFFGIVGGHIAVIFFHK